MQYPPNDHQPAAWTVLNGDPVWSADVREVDKYHAWLAASRKWACPVAIGSPLTQANTAIAVPFRLWIPPYTQYVSLEYLITGVGTVTATADSDPWNSVTPSYAYDAGLHLYSNAWVISQGPPQIAVVGHGLDRALAMVYQASPQTTHFTLKVTDDVAGGKTLRVWAVRAVMLQPNETVTLPLI